MENGNQIGVVGLGTMGRALALNMRDHGFRVAGLDLSHEQVAAMAAESEGQVAAFALPEEFISSLALPRAILLLVPAGAPVDAVIASLTPLLSKGDILIDGGNSYYRDTERRRGDLAQTGLEFIGIGVSGGEEGARHGPSMMAGGTPEAFARIAPILEAIGAKADDGASCADRVGSGAAGHYVKMVHNGIEYGMMQLIAETYDFLRRACDSTNEEAAAAFGTYAKSNFGGYLLEITESVLLAKDSETGDDLVDLIVDGAQQKGTGKWTSQDAMDLHVPVPTIDAAVSARDLSSFRDERKKASAVLGKLPITIEPDVDRIGDALQAAFLLTYSQGFSVLTKASVAYGMDVDLAKAASVWRAGCIIRSKMLPEFRAIFTSDPTLPNLLLSREIAEKMSHLEGSLRWLVTEMARARIPCPAMSASLSYLDGFSSARLPANLIQGLRDRFGNHGFERIDQPGVFHGDWNGE